MRYSHFKSIWLTNVLAVFMNLMNRVFKSYIDIVMVIFIDDSLIYSHCEELQMSYFRVVLQTLRDKQLFEKFSKCVFWLKEVVFLRHVVSSDGIKVNAKRLQQ